MAAYGFEENYSKAWQSGQTPEKESGECRTAEN